ncbi:hypothetical protein KQI84_15340 [bacterium]|nr:hypothetical protein [bacterium]
MDFIYMQQSGKPVDGAAGRFWTLAGVAIPDIKWRSLQIRLNGLLRSFNRDATTHAPMLDANTLLHPRNAEKGWTLGLCKGFLRIVSGLDARFFLVVVDKATTDRPAHSRWLLPLSYQYLLAPITQLLAERETTGTIVIPPGRPEELDILCDIQTELLGNPDAGRCGLVGYPLIQRPQDACGLQVADFVATVARRYHEYVFPKLFAKQILHGHDAQINALYQGLVKRHTYQSEALDPRGYPIRGFVYLWRREAAKHDRYSETATTGADRSD